MKVYKAPDYVPTRRPHPSVFLAGSIEMGAAVDWQKVVTAELAHFKELDVYNPRRDDWDSSWVQSIDNPQFNQQVTWEMDQLDKATFIFLYFAPETKSPISLLELGLHARLPGAGDRMIVTCPDKFWRRGNVEMVTERYGITLKTTLEAGVSELVSRITKYPEMIRKRTQSGIAGEKWGL